MSDTVFNIDFDFTSSSQDAVLKQLQGQNFKLLAYKGATGPAQVAAGLPTWISVPFTELFGLVDIAYEPTYKVYVFNQETIDGNTTISMDNESDPIGLGNAVNLTADGRFTSAGNSPDGTITVHSLRQGGTDPVTVGLAGKVIRNGVDQFLPFCAFTLNPEGSLAMTPHENVAIMAAQTDLQSGSVAADASAPGCSFTFDSSNDVFNLMVMTDGTFTITGVPGGGVVSALTSGATLSILNG